MLICKNIKSNENFVVLGESKNGLIHAITPQGKITYLKIELFDEELEEGTKEEFLKDKKITIEQMKQNEFLKKSEHESFLEVGLEIFSRLTEEGKKSLIKKLERIVYSRPDNRLNSQ